MSAPSSFGLTSLAYGKRAVVAEVVGPAARVDKLAALGILPGAEIVVVQRRPVYILECGELTVAVEKDLAELIRVG